MAVRGGGGVVRGRSCAPVVVSGVQRDVIRNVPRHHARAFLARRGLVVTYHLFLEERRGRAREETWMKASRVDSTVDGTNKNASIWCNCGDLSKLLLQMSKRHERRRVFQLMRHRSRGTAVSCRVCHLGQRHPDQRQILVQLVGMSSSSCGGPRSSRRYMPLWSYTSYPPYRGMSPKTTCKANLHGNWDTPSTCRWE